MMKAQQSPEVAEHAKNLVELGVTLEPRVLTYEDEKGSTDLKSAEDVLASHADVHALLRDNSVQKEIDRALAVGKERAAVKIQAIYRGKTARKGLVEEDAAEVQAAIKVQAITRGYTARFEIEEARRLEWFNYYKLPEVGEYDEALKLACTAEERAAVDAAQEASRVEWVRYYVATGNLSEAKRLLWDGKNPAPPGAGWFRCCYNPAPPAGGADRAEKFRAAIVAYDFAEAERLAKGVRHHRPEVVGVGARVVPEGEEGDGEDDDRRADEDVEEVDVLARLHEEEELPVEKLLPRLAPRLALRLEKLLLPLLERHLIPEHHYVLVLLLILEPHLNLEHHLTLVLLPRATGSRGIRSALS